MKKFLIGIGALAVIAIGILFYLNRQTDYLPEWYASEIPENSQNQGHSVTDPSTGQSGQQEPTAIIRPQVSPPAAETAARRNIRNTMAELNRSGEARFDEAMVNESIWSGLDQQFPGTAREMVKALKTGINEEQIKIEMVVNPKKIPWDDLPDALQISRGFLGQMGLTQKDELFISIEGKPLVRGDRIVMDDNAQIQMGGLKFPLNTLLGFAGSSDKIKTSIDIKDVPFKQLRLVKGAVILQQ